MDFMLFYLMDSSRKCLAVILNAFICSQGRVAYCLVFPDGGISFLYVYFRYYCQ
ncbi:hypothetical protein GJAV_G00209060 [Gymnothorax javanicus]|nr:hypothetical protein GJAV_G00209060 [Gymnothorax javanicus]